MQGNNQHGSQGGNINISSIKIRKSLMCDECPALEINIEYPEMDDNPNKKFCEKFNDFYKCLAKNYCEYCEGNLFKKISGKIKKSGIGKAYGEIMKFYITYKNDKYLSVLVEITHFDGYFSSVYRITHVWNIDERMLLPSSYFCKKMKITHKKIKRIVGNIIKESIEKNKCGFSVTDKSARRYAYNVNPDNYFLTGSGLAFYFLPGTLAPESEGFPTFVVKCDLTE